MKEIVTKAGRVEVVEPWEAGKYDPPMQEWLQLPVGAGEDNLVCPTCGSSHFTTANPRGYFHVLVCRDEHRVSCSARYRNEVTTLMILEVIEALNGIPRRFVMK